MRVVCFHAPRPVPPSWATEGKRILYSAKEVAFRRALRSAASLTCIVVGGSSDHALPPAPAAHEVDHRIVQGSPIESHHAPQIIQGSPELLLVQPPSQTISGITAPGSGVGQPTTAIPVYEPSSMVLLFTAAVFLFLARWNGPNRL